MNCEYQEFVDSEGEPVPYHLHNFTREYVKISLHPGMTILKFFTLQLLGMTGTLFLCPQYGISFGQDHNTIIMLVMRFGPVVCGAFCAGIFFSGGALLNFLFLTGVEARWLKDNSFGLIIFFNTLIFVLMMISKNLELAHMHFQDMSFDIMWVICSFLIMILGFRYFESGLRARSSRLH